MKFLRVMLSGVVLMALSTVAFAQSDAQKSFDKMKSLAGSWEGRVTTVPPQPGMGDGAILDVSLVMVNLMGDWRSPWLDFAVGYIPLYGLLLLGAFFVNEAMRFDPRITDPTKPAPSSS